jgi:hypothetical protein
MDKVQKLSSNECQSDMFALILTIVKPINCSPIKHQRVLNIYYIKECIIMCCVLKVYVLFHHFTAVSTSPLASDGF